MFCTANRKVSNVQHSEYGQHLNVPSHKLYTKLIGNKYFKAISNFETIQKKSKPVLVTLGFDLQDPVGKVCITVMAFTSEELAPGTGSSGVTLVAFETMIESVPAAQWKRLKAFTLCE